MRKGQTVLVSTPAKPEPRRAVLVRRDMKQRAPFLVRFPDGTKEWHFGCHLEVVPARDVGSL